MPSSTVTKSNEDTWVTLAVLAQPHGVSGRMKVKSFTDPADDFARHPLTDEAGNTVTVTLTGHAQGMPVVAIDGVTKREQAELLRGKKLGIPRAALPKITNPNQFYVSDLVTMQVVDAEGTPFGEVIHVMNYGASDILEIRRTNGREEMYAFTHATFPTVDITARRIVIDPPELLDATDPRQGDSV